MTDKERKRYSKHIAKLNRRTSGHRRTIISIVSVYLIALALLGLYLIVTHKN